MEELTLNSLKISEEIYDNIVEEMALILLGKYRE